MPDAVLVHEALRQRQAAIELAEDRVVAHAYALELDLSVVGRHVERPPVELHVQPGCVARDDERGDAERLSRGARRARKHQVVAGTVHA